MVNAQQWINEKFPNEIERAKVKKLSIIIIIGQFPEIEVNSYLSRRSFTNKLRSKIWGSA